MGLSIQSIAMKLPDEIREFFRKQGRIGAAKRVAGMTPERRSEIAKIAAQARWSKQPKTAQQKANSSSRNVFKKSTRTGGTK